MAGKMKRNKDVESEDTKVGLTIYTYFSFQAYYLCC